MTNQWPPPPPSPFQPSGTGLGSGTPPFGTEPRPPAPGPSTVMIAVIIGVVTMLIAAGVAALVLRDDKVIATAPTTTQAARSTSTTRSGPSTTVSGSTPSTVRPSTDLDRFVDEAIAFVEKERGLKFTTKPAVVALDDAAFVARFRDLVDEDSKKNKDIYDDATGLFQAIGFLGRDMTYIDAQKLLGEGGVVGYYDQESKELRVRAGQVTPYVRTVIVHELTHALDDQRFDLNRPQYDSADDEIGFGFVALAEGNARRVENAYRESMSAVDQASAATEELKLGAAGASVLSKLTLALLQLEYAPYDLGEKFVDAVIAKGGQAALDKVFADPPTTSEQVIDPSKYFAKEPRRTVNAPQADAAPFKTGVFGQIVLQMMLGSANTARVAETAASGWAGDWFVAWNESNRSCLRVDFVMDSAKDTTELRDALTKWAQSRPSAKVSNAGDAVELTTCSR
ncbi:MAG: hypothetical protein ABI658_30560 [Acidimicrobiales bacterium]